MDFFQFRTKEINKGTALELYPDFVVDRSKDLMVRGKAFYAIWNEAAGLWSTDEYDVVRLVDAELARYAEEIGAEKVKYLANFDNNVWTKFQKFLKSVSDNYKVLDDKLTFANTEVKKSDYVSRRLPYDLTAGDISAWNELIGTLYNPEEKAKIEWAIGCVVAGDSTKIQKFVVLFGPPGKGKGTVIDIILKLFEGYTTTFDAKALTGNGNAFATEAFKGNPLVAIQHDGDLSRIEDNTKLNSIVSHEVMKINEKYKPTYDDRIKAFLFMGSNNPVKITDGKSGMIRRLIDVKPTGNTVSPNRYHALMAQIDFNLGAIARHCLNVYRDMGRNFYAGYQPMEMLYQTNVFFNFIEAHFDIFKEQDGTSLKQAYVLYKTWCEDTGIEKPLPQYKVRAQLMDHFKDFHERYQVGDIWLRSYYTGFTALPFKAPVPDDASVFSLVLDDTISLLDLVLADQPAQGAKVNDDGAEVPMRSWMSVKTTLAEIDTSELHYVQLPENHIVIDFDIKVDGKKSLEENLKAASDWPPTYAELSKGGNGVHLHYIYDGDVHDLAQHYAEGVEVKTLLGSASLRRKLTRCNDIPIATISSGLPFKEKKVISTDVVKSEKALRALIERNFRKEIHPGTKPSIDFIHKILEDAYKSGMQYDVSDLHSRLIAFANNSSNQAMTCLKTVQRMKFKSEEAEEVEAKEITTKDDRIVFFDIEVYPNLFVICWKYQGDEVISKMINPTPQEVEGLFQYKLVGFNNRRYDNHILWARYMGYDLEGLFKLSQKIIGGSVGAQFGEARNLSYADIYDFSSVKQSLKKFGVDQGLYHMELDIPWDQPVPEELWLKVVEYCCNDVKLTEATFEDRKEDFVARQILAELSGLSVNDTTQRHTAKIVFNGSRNPQSDFIYTDLSKMFPGYTYGFGKSSYREENPSEGGYVYAEPGMYEDVAVLDVASMHPTSIIQLDLFGIHTGRFKDLVDARLAIKHEDFETARTMLDGKLAPYLKDESGAEKLSYALKIAINIVYGLTSATFDNPFKDPRNKDNIVAKRGALFMIDLKHFVQELGYQVVHIKTDSIKIPHATDEIIEEVKKFGEKYGYSFEHEATFDKFCLVNNAVYIARYGWAAKEKKIGTWDAVGAQFQHPYVFKTLFGGDGDNSVLIDDLCETKQVVNGGAIYMDFTKDSSRSQGDPDGLHFIGKIGRFVPVLDGYGGGILWRVKDGKHFAVSGTKGYLWVEAAVAKELGGYAVDHSYFEKLASDAREAISKYGDFEKFIEE